MDEKYTQITSIFYSRIGRNGIRGQQISKRCHNLGFPILWEKTELKLSEAWRGHKGAQTVNWHLGSGMTSGSLGMLHNGMRIPLIWRPVFVECIVFYMKSEKQYKQNNPSSCSSDIDTCSLKKGLIFCCSSRDSRESWWIPCLMLVLLCGSH